MSETVTGAERYKAGVMKYREMGYWEPDYEPKDTDVICLFRITVSDGVDTYSEQSHVIVFWEYAGGIENLRVLHARMELKQRLGPPNPST